MNYYSALSCSRPRSDTKGGVHGGGGGGGGGGDDDDDDDDDDNKNNPPSTSMSIAMRVTHLDKSHLPL